MIYIVLQVLLDFIQPTKKGTQPIKKLVPFISKGFWEKKWGQSS